jgi:hypothetical protein
MFLGREWIYSILYPGGKLMCTFDGHLGCEQHNPAAGASSVQTEGRLGQLRHLEKK